MGHIFLYILNGRFLLMMERACQRLVTYALDFCLRMAAMIWLATFSTGITQKRPSPFAIAVSTRPGRMSETARVRYIQQRHHVANRGRVARRERQFAVGREGVVLCRAKRQDRADAHRGIEHSLSVLERRGQAER